MFNLYQQLGIVKWVSTLNTPINIEAKQGISELGVGNKNADLMVICETLDSREDQQDEPFIGREGELFTAMIHTIGFTRQDIDIATLTNGRPFKHRDSLPEEVATCMSSLQQQIQRVQPKLLLVVGETAAQHLLNTESSLESLRGKLHWYGESKTPLIVTYHPAYLLQNAIDKKKSFVDLQFVLQQLQSE